MTHPHPSDPIGPLMAGAYQFHELYQSFCRAGFTSEQAMQLVSTVLAEATRAGIGQQPGGSQ
jgi:hypothetical protein